MMKNRNPVPADLYTGTTFLSLLLLSPHQSPTTLGVVAWFPSKVTWVKSSGEKQFEKHLLGQAKTLQLYIVTLTSTAAFFVVLICPRVERSKNG